jgi:S-disulfanyl-L-cysteine oxidoreductase SoxD
MTTWLCTRLAALLATVAALSACDSGAGKGALRLQPQDPQVLALGAQVYTAHCAACHGAQLQGQPDWRTPGPGGLLPAPPHDASGHTWHHPDQLLFDITKYGVARAAGLKNHASGMPAYEGVLKDEEIVAVLSWIKAQWPPEIQARHNRINEAAQRERERR